MKSTQLLSVVFSLIMFTGVTAGNTAFADSDELDDILENFCEMTETERSDIVSKYELDEYAEKLAIICDIEDDIDRENSLDDVIDAIELERFDEIDDESVDVIEDFEDCVEAGYPIMESFPEQCMTDDGQVFTNTDDDDSDDDDDKVLVCHKGKNTLSISHDALRAHLAHGDYKGKCGSDTRPDYNLDDRLAHFCDMSAEEKRQFFEDHPRLAQFSERLLKYCELSDYSRDSKLKDFIRNHITDEDRHKVRDHVKDHVKDYVKDKLGDKDIDAEFRKKLAQWCEMSADEKSTTAAQYDKTEDQIAKADRYCTLNETDRAEFIAEHRDEFRAHMKTMMKDKVMDKMHDKMADHMDYDRLCKLTESDRALEITDVAKLDRLSKWCQMTPEEREEYKKEHHDTMKDKVKDHMKDRFSHMEFDRFCKMTDAELSVATFDAEFVDRASKWCEMTPDERKGYAKDHMKDKVMDKKQDMKMKLSDKSDRLKAMIMNKHDISDERRDEIKQKFIEKHGDLTDEKKSELKMKFKDHMKNIKHKISDERKSAIHDRLAEMKAFKAELREKSSDLTDEEKQELRAEFIEKAKDMQLAWISPRVQITAGVDATEVECREGFSLVMKASNGVPMCLKADTALKMIDRGFVIPAN